MGFIALILALLIEQVRPLSRANPVHRGGVFIADSIAASTDAGTASAAGGRLPGDSGGR
jgi:hypothetical protein